MNRDYSVVLEIASTYCISDSFVDHDGYSISSKNMEQMASNKGIVVVGITRIKTKLHFTASVQFSRSVVSNSL